MARVHGWKSLPSGARPGWVTARQWSRWVSPPNDPGHDLVGEERTEGTVRNQQVGQSIGRGHRHTAGGRADGGEIWTWAGGHGTTGGGTGREGCGGNMGRWAGPQQQGGRVGHAGWDLLILSECRCCSQHVKARDAKVQLVNSGYWSVFKGNGLGCWNNFHF